ncbi:MAG TPA: vitamin K epoxide reductase family protein [Silvibacterium sp.]|nr:vitamin K epoxide reductase family protein [Silvibacterium sp.]
MRYLIAFLAVAGIVVSTLALRVHYSTDVQPCDINAHWDCGIVNHSRYSEILHIPVAAIGIAGYLLLAVAALMRRRVFSFATALAALAFSLHLTDIEAHKLEVWCLYCVISQGIIALITICSLIWLFIGRGKNAAGPVAAPGVTS